MQNTWCVGSTVKVKKTGLYGTIKTVLIYYPNQTKFMCEIKMDDGRELVYRVDINGGPEGELDLIQSAAKEGLYTKDEIVQIKAAFEKDLNWFVKK